MGSLKDSVIEQVVDYQIFNIIILFKRNWYRANIRSSRKKYFYVVSKFNKNFAGSNDFVQIFADNKIYAGDKLHKCDDLRQKNMIAYELTEHDCTKTIYTYASFKQIHQYEYGKFYLLFNKIRKEYRKRKFKKK